MIPAASFPLVRGKHQSGQICSVVRPGSHDRSHHRMRYCWRLALVVLFEKLTAIKSKTMRQFGLISFHSVILVKNISRKDSAKGASALFLPVFRCEHQRPPELIRDRPGLKGLNVTIRTKKEIIPLLNSLSGPASEAIGAVNTISIQRTDGIISTTGHNTDAYGFEKSGVAGCR